MPDGFVVFLSSPASDPSEEQSGLSPANDSDSEVYCDSVDQFGQEEASLTHTHTHAHAHSIYNKETSTLMNDKRAQLYIIDR